MNFWLLHDKWFSTFFRGEHGVGSNDDEHHIYDGVVGPLGFGLEILKYVDELGYSLVLEMLMLHIILQCEDVEGMNPTTIQLEVDEKFYCDNQGVVGLVPLDFADPRVFNNAEDEFNRFAFRAFISCEVADAGLVNGVLPRSHWFLFVFPNGRIGDGGFLGEGERGGVIRHVGHQILNESDKLMDGVLLVVRNDEEDLGKYLMEFIKM